MDNVIIGLVCFMVGIHYVVASIEEDTCYEVDISDEVIKVDASNCDANLVFEVEQ